jgi:hypothetical protein
MPIAQYFDALRAADREAIEEQRAPAHRLTRASLGAGAIRYLTAVGSFANIKEDGRWS